MVWRDLGDIPPIKSDDISFIQLAFRILLFGDALAVLHGLLRLLPPVALAVLHSLLLPTRYRYNLYLTRKACLLMHWLVAVLHSLLCLHPQLSLSTPILTPPHH